MTINIDEERGFSLSLRRNRPTDAFRNSIKEAPTSVGRLALEETDDVYGYKDDSVGCSVKMRLDACEDNINPLYFALRGNGAA